MLVRSGGTWTELASPLRRLSVMRVSGRVRPLELLHEVLAFDVDVGQHPVEPARQPPGSTVEQGHGGGHDHHPHHGGVEEDGGGEADGEQLLDRVVHQHERSEEHTSELQSLMRISYAVFCLKKKKTTPSTTK